LTEPARENAPGGPIPVRWTAPIAVLVALAAALGYALAAVPNIELITLTVFISGAVLGRLRGAMVGLMAMGIYSGFAPYGSGLAIPTLFAGQLGAMALVGFSGGILGGLWRGRTNVTRIAAAAAAGLVLTGVYQTAVVVGYAAMSPEFADGFLAALTANLFFPYVHIIWNTVLFAVLVPLLVPRVRRLAVGGGQAVVPTVLAMSLLVAAGLLAVPVTVMAQDPIPSELIPEPELAPECELTPEDGHEVEGEPVRPTVALPDSLGIDLWSGPLGVRRVVDLELGSAHDASIAAGALPALRVLSSRWPGQRASVTRGGIPAGLSVVTVTGRSGGDWISDGLGYLDAVSTGGRVLVPSGPDVSTRALFGSGVVSFDRGGPAPGVAAGTGSSLLTYHTGRRFAGTPFSRVGMASGGAGLRWRVVEFGSGLRERGAVTGFFEGRSGRGPGPGGEYERDSFGTSATLDLSEGWTAEFSGSSVTASRSVPDAAGVSGAVLSISSGAADLAITNGSARFGIFHAATRVGDRRADGDGVCESGRTGAVIDLPVELGLLRSVHAHASGLVAKGDLLSDGVRALSVGASANGGVRFGGWEASVTAGASRQRGETVPELSCLLLREGPKRGPWFTIDVGGRFPTALELVGVDRTVVGDTDRLIGGAGAAGGAGDLRAEQAATAGLGWAFASGRLDAGVTGEVTRVLSPIVLEDDTAGVLRPVSAENATASMVALWAAVVDTARGGMRMSAEAIGIDADGPLNALAPVPQFTAHASVWVDRRFFKQTLDVRAEVSIGYETGLARGVWDGVLDDALWRTRLSVHGAVGPARLLITVDDPFDTDSGGWPGYTFSEPRVTYAFIWDFWN